MKTVWGDNLDPSNVLKEYPRPQMVRDSYLNLNGIWNYAITNGENFPNSFDGEILVPFSPECELSGVMRMLSPHQTLWYQRNLSIPSNFNRGRVILHFGAVDQVATVYINGVEVCNHVGGYTPFSADITDFLQRENSILVKVRDFSDTSFHSRGKQKSNRGGIWYTAQSGIWQTVWLESVPVEHISSLKLTPLFDESALELTVLSTHNSSCNAIVKGTRIDFPSNTPTKIYLKDIISWTPEDPHLYDLTVTLGEDVVQSYFAMRKFSVGKDEEGAMRLLLNNKPYFHNGLLDQGYYSDGMYTPPSDGAMIFDIQTAKDMGFNMLRKHIKIEPLRWYYHCDRLGMLVWQDMINGGGNYPFITISAPVVANLSFKDHHYKLFGRDEPQGREQYYRELREMINHLYNCVSICMWVPFNEGWGQFDSEIAVRMIQELDQSRTIDHASGWHDQHIGEIQSLHVYFKKYCFKHDKLGRAVVLSEFGGYNLRIPGHSFNEKDYGYKKFKTAEELLHAFKELYTTQIAPAKKKGLSAAVYTQLTDVEDELNGLITYDRKVIKLPVEEVRTHLVND